MQHNTQKDTYFPALVYHWLLETTYIQFLLTTLLTDSFFVFQDFLETYLQE